MFQSGHPWALLAQVRFSHMREGQAKALKVNMCDQLCDLLCDSRIAAQRVILLQLGQGADLFVELYINDFLWSPLEATIQQSGWLCIVSLSGCPQGRQPGRICRAFISSFISWPHQPTRILAGAWCTFSPTRLLHSDTAFSGDSSHSKSCLPGHKLRCCRRPCQKYMCASFFIPFNWSRALLTISLCSVRFASVKRQRNSVCAFSAP